LVSDHTSFIVLELLQDYADHGIRPPEAELQKEYNELVAKRTTRRAADPGGFAHGWADRLRWFDRRFPGYEALILPRVRQVGIWKRAVESQFAPAQRDAEAFATIAGWFDKAGSLIADRPKLRSKEDYANWRKLIGELHALGPELAKTPLHPPPVGQALAVSVRGLVAKPGVVTATSAMTLRQSIEKAGGLHSVGSLDNVALYRNAGKVVYNMLSKEFQDIPLFPCDMVVVGLRNSRWDDIADPFSGSSSPRDAREEVPVREQGDLWIAPSAGHAPFSNLGGGSPATPAGIRTHSPPPMDDHSEAGMPDFAPFEKALASGGDPEAAYRKLQSKDLYQPRFQIEAARLLFAKKHPDLARRVLSNLVESRPGDLSAVRAYAFWLAEFGQVEEAALVLAPLLDDGATTLQPRLDLASIQAFSGNPAAVARTLYPALEDIQSSDSASLAAIALTEHNALHHSLGEPGAANPMVWQGDDYQRNLAADIRIVATSTGDGNSLRFEIREPGGSVCSSAASPSPFGGQITASGGMREYMIRRAVPGVYQVTCASDHPATVRLVLHTRWGHPDQESKVVTLLLDTDRMQQVGEIEFEFQEGGK
jgi:hypothetical protein